MEILRLKPAIKDYIWGGTRLISQWNKDALGASRIAECWELSMHEDGLSVVEGGTYNGKTLKEVLSLCKGALGVDAQRFSSFPLLIKIIDAKENLSVQVHPNDEFALKYEGDYGKSEVWYIVEADLKSGVYSGFSRDITKDELKERLLNGTITEVLNFKRVKKGDVVFIKAGTMHAIGKGLTLIEVQQSSNATYRVYDFGRVGANGLPRELHIEKALAVTNLEAEVEAEESARINLLKEPRERVVSRHEFFNVTEYDLSLPFSLSANEKSFHALIFAKGNGIICGRGQSLNYKMGDTFFVPAGFLDYDIVPSSHTTFLLSNI